MNRTYVSYELLMEILKIENWHTKSQGVYKNRPQHRSMKLHPCPTQNSAFQASHCSALLMGCVKYCSRLYTFELSLFRNVIHWKANSNKMTYFHSVFSNDSFYFKLYYSLENKWRLWNWNLSFSFCGFVHFSILKSGVAMAW